MMNNGLGRLRRFSLTLLTIPLVLVGVGCAGGTNLTVTSLQNHQTYLQPVSKAYAGRSDDGDLDVVLVSDDGNAPKTVATGVRQVMHIRVLWKPMKGVKLDNPTATNAAIDWYVFSDPDKAGAGSDGLVAYTGAGFVNVQQSGSTVTLNIRNATLSPTTRQGGMIDPLGGAKLQGAVVARAGRGEEVRALLSAARQASARLTDREVTVRQASSRTPVEP
jgi:hypothetical protein